MGQAGREGRVDLIGARCSLLGGKDRAASAPDGVEGPCRTGEVVAYPEALAEEAERNEKPRSCGVVLWTTLLSTQPGLWRSGGRRGWEARGPKLYYLPAYYSAGV